jgi:hypothetical protein
VTWACSPEPYHAQVAVRLTGPLLAKRRRVHNGLIGDYTPRSIIRRSLRVVDSNKFLTVSTVYEWGLATIWSSRGGSPADDAPRPSCGVIGSARSAIEVPGTLGKQIRRCRKGNARRGLRRSRPRWPPGGTSAASPLNAQRRRLCAALGGARRKSGLPFSFLIRLSTVRLMFVSPVERIPVGRPRERFARKTLRVARDIPHRRWR